MTLFEIGNKVMFVTPSRIESGTIIDVKCRKEAFTHKILKIFSLDTGTSVTCYEIEKEGVMSHVGLYRNVRMFDEKIYSKVKSNLELMSKLDDENVKFFFEKEV